MAMALEQRLEQSFETQGTESLSRPCATTKVHTDTLKTITLGRQGLKLQHYVCLKNQCLHERFIRFLLPTHFQCLTHSYPW